MSKKVENLFVCHLICTKSHLRIIEQSIRGFVVEELTFESVLGSNLWKSQFHAFLADVNLTKNLKSLDLLTVIELVTTGSW